VWVIAKIGSLDCNWDRRFTDIICLYSTTVTYLARKAIDFREKRKIRALRRSRSFKVIEVGTNRKRICDFLLVIDSNWRPISFRFAVIAAYCSKFGHCVLEPPFAGLRDNVRCESWAHWKTCTGLHISDSWTFSLDVTAEALRAKIDLKSAISL